MAARRQQAPLMRRPWLCSLLGLLLALACSAAWLYHANVGHRSVPPLELTELRVERSGDAAALWLRGSGLSDSSQFLLTPDAGNSQRIVCNLPFWSRLTDIELFGRYALLANNKNGLRLVDIDNPAQPAIVATLTLPDSALGVAVRDQYAYVANNRAGLSVVSLRDPHRLELVGSCVLPGFALRVVLSGPLAFVACMRGGLQIVDISNPHAPRHIGSFTDYSNTFDLAVFGHLVFLANGTEGLAIIDVSNPRQPALLARQPLEGVAMDVIVRADGFAFLTGVRTGLVAIDVRQPRQPVLAGRLEASPRACGLEPLDDTRLILCTMDGVLQVEAAEPHRLQPQGEVHTDDQMRALRLRGGLAFLAGSSSFKVIDVAGLQPSPQPAPMVVGSVPLLALEGEELLIATEGQLSTLRLTGNTLTATEREPIAIPQEPRLLVRRGALAAMVFGGPTLHLLNLDQPAATGTIRLDLDSRIRSLALQPPLVIVGLEDGLRILRLSAGDGGLEELARLPLRRPVVDLLADGPWLYLANEQDGLRIVDIREPQQPALVSSFAAGWPENKFSIANGLAKQGDRLYLSCMRTGLFILDVSDPRRPLTLQVVSMPQMSLTVLVAGSFAYVRRADEIAIIDITGPVAQLLGTLPGTRHSYSMVATADRLIVGNTFGPVTAMSPPLRLSPAENQPGPLKLPLPADLADGHYLLQINNFRNGTTESVQRYFTF